MDDFSVSVPGCIDNHARISLYSLVNFSKIFIILRKLPSVLGVPRQNFCPRVGK